jgi:HEAT repeat protein
VIADVLGPTRLATLASGTPCPPPPAPGANGAPAAAPAPPAGCVTVAVRTLIAQALAEAASPEAVTPLIRLLEDSDPEVVRTAAAGLGRTGDPAAGAPLFALLSRHPDMQQSIFDAMSRSIGARGMAQLLSAASDPALKLRLVEMLRRTHDPAAAESLTAQLAATDPAIRAAAALGLAELGDPHAVPALVEIAKGDNENAAQNALDALRALHAPVPSAELFAMLEAHPGRRAAVLHAVGASGDSSAGPFLERELAGEDVETALVALGELRYEPAYRQILAMVTRPRDIDFTEPSPANENAYRNRRKAMESLGYYGKPDAIPALLTVIEDAEDDARLRATAGETLGILADEATMRTVLEKIRNSSLDEASRRYYAQALWQKPNRTLAADLVTLLEGSLPGEVQRAVSLAVGYAADASVDARVNALFGNADKAREAMFAVVLGGSEEGATRLLTYLKDNPDAREVIDFALNSEDNDAFNVLLPEMFDSGAVFRRMRVAQVLRDGTETGGHYSTPWQRLFERLNVGWSGPHGITAAVIREKLYAAMTGTDASLRSLAADILGDMGERGLLIRARDSRGVGSMEAREKLRTLNRVASA